MKTSRFLMVTVAILGVSLATKANDLNTQQREALKQTQELLRNPNQRQQVINNDPKAKATDIKIEQSLGGAQNK